MAGYDTVNCASCGVLVYTADVPSRKTGNCWRCEVKMLQSRVEYLEKERGIRGEVRALHDHLSQRGTLTGEERTMKAMLEGILGGSSSQDGQRQVYEEG